MKPASSPLPVRTAGWFRRFGGGAFDAAAVTGVWATLGAALEAAGVVTMPHSRFLGLDAAVDIALQAPSMAFAGVGLWLGLWTALVGALCRAVGSGRTPGERLTAAATVGRHGRRLGPWRGAAHALAAALTAALAGVGPAWALVDAERRSLADRLLGTWRVCARDLSEPGRR